MQTNNNDNKAYLLVEYLFPSQPSHFRSSHAQSRRNTISRLFLSFSVLLCTHTLIADSLLLPPGSDIQAAINILTDGDTIELQTGSYFPTSTLTTDGKALTIRGDTDALGNPSSIIDGQDAIRVLQCSNGEGSDTVFENLVITGGVSVAGGGMYNNSSPTLINCTFTENSADFGAGLYNIGSNSSITNCTFTQNESDYGGGIHSDGGEPTFNNCSFTSNFAESFGGAMYIGTDSLATLINCTFDNNSTEYRGGGIFTYFCELTITNCTFINNIAGSSGGAMRNFASEPTINDCTFTNNTALLEGGAIYNSSSSVNPIATSNVSLSGSAFDNNTASRGGAIFNGADCTTDLSNCSFNENAADENGGAIANYVSTSTVINCVFTRNSAFSQGGAQYCFDTNFILVRNSDFSLNTAPVGGAVSHNDQSETTYRSCTFNNNTASSSAGAMYNNAQSPAVVINCVFESNTAEGKGGAGAIRESSSSSSFTDCTFTNNVASNGNGGAIFTINGSSTWSACTFEENQSEGFGGGLYFFTLGATPSISGSTIRNNNAAAGGGIYNANVTLSLDSTEICSNTPDQVSPAGGYVDNGGNTIEQSCGCLADLNGDGFVNGADLTILLADWGAPNSIADFNEDGTVDGADLTVVLGNWGPC